MWFQKLENRPSLKDVVQAKRIGARWKNRVKSKKQNGTKDTNKNDGPETMLRHQRTIATTISSSSSSSASFSSASSSSHSPIDKNATKNRTSKIAPKQINNNVNNNNRPKNNLATQKVDKTLLPLGGGTPIIITTPLNSKDNANNNQRNRAKSANVQLKNQKHKPETSDSQETIKNTTNNNKKNNNNPTLDKPSPMNDDNVENEDDIIETNYSNLFDNNNNNVTDHENIKLVDSSAMTYKGQEDQQNSQLETNLLSNEDDYEQNSSQSLIMANISQINEKMQNIDEKSQVLRNTAVKNQNLRISIENKIEKLSLMGVTASTDSSNNNKQ